MKVYTKTGDKGTTGLLSGERIEKDSLRVEAYGNVDEINSALGVARVWATQEEVKETIFKLQKALMMLMAELASTKTDTPYITPEHIAELEGIIDRFDAKLPALREFLVPGGTAGAAALDVVRTTTRRAERQVIRLSRSEAVRPELAIFLNRLSDLSFILMRVELEAAKA